MNWLLVISLCIVGVTFAHKANGQNPEVRPPVGKIKGSIIKSRLGKDIYSFRGVRYAEPPTGELRFQPPKPIADWNNVFDASEDGPGCPAIGGLNMSEDCLRLNVYTTKLPSKRDKVCRPVIVFFHQGGFYSFSGQSAYHGPQYMLDKDVVLVTVNYRLGSLGFISTGDAQAPGNAGFKDQVAALRWVQRNIAAFGGDPNSVTITGCSAGSISVMLHMLSPMSKNLFHRVIALSASVTGVDTEFVVPYEQKALAEKQAVAVGCTTNTTAAMMACLRSKPVEEFIRTMDKLFEWYGFPMLLWKPIIEPEVPGVERFLTDHPVNLYRQKKFYKVPVIMGCTRDEFAGLTVNFELPAMAGNDQYYKEIDQGWNRIAPIVFYYPQGTPRSQHINDELRQFYFKDQPISSATRQGLADLLADGIIKFSMYRVAKLIAENQRQPVYFYEFTQPGRYSFNMWNSTTPYGVVHQDDLQYLFYMSQNFPYVEENAPEIPMINLLTSVWSGFAKNGHPLPRNNPNVKGVQWNRLRSAPFNYLDLNLHPSMKTGFYPERMALWERLFPLPPLPANSTAH